MASAIRSEVYFAFSRDEAKSTSDIARELGKANPAVRHHVNELVRVGLIIAVATRKRRSRTEDLYVTKARRWTVDTRPGRSQDYLHQVNRGFSSILRAIDRERHASISARFASEEPPFPTLFRMGLPRLTPKQAAEVAERMSKMIDDFGGLNTPEESRYRMVVYIQPTLAESRDAYQRLTGNELGETPDD